VLGETRAVPITRVIGALEILMALWILSGVMPRLNAVVQMALVSAMNALELVLAPDLLLWGYANVLVALAFIAVIGVNEWVLAERGPVPRPAG